MQTLHNDNLTITINDFGAELSSIKKNETQREYLWQADPKYWKRHSPVLFPIVGSVWNGEYKVDNKTYKLSQHGFARDNEFTMMNKTDNEVSYIFKSNEQTKEKYPFEFELIISYKLEKNAVHVCWEVKNTSPQMMYFQIGAHPAFNYMNYNENTEVEGYIKMNNKEEKLELTVIGEKGCAKKEREAFIIKDNKIAIKKDTFNRDALIFDKKQVSEVTLLDSKEKEYIKVSFDSPLVGIWSPKKDEFSPFICIEPWYGRCDSENYTGEFKDREHMQCIESGKGFNAEYAIEIL